MMPNPAMRKRNNEAQINFNKSSGISNEKSRGNPIVQMHQAALTGDLDTILKLECKNHEDLMKCILKQKIKAGIADKINK